MSNPRPIATVGGRAFAAMDDADFDFVTQDISRHFGHSSFHMMAFDGLRREVARHRWRPIETAPKDRCIDLWTGDRRMTRCYWDHICAEWRTTGNSNVLICFKKATHWMEIPAPPAGVIP